MAKDVYNLRSLTALREGSRLLSLESAAAAVALAQHDEYYDEATPPSPPSHLNVGFAQRLEGLVAPPELNGVDHSHERLGVKSVARQHALKTPRVSGGMKMTGDVSVMKHPCVTDPCVV